MDSALDRQAERLRAMTADEKVRLAHALWLEAREVVEAGVRARHPDGSDEEVAAAVRELMRDAGAWPRRALHRLRHRSADGRLMGQPPGRRRPSVQGLLTPSADGSAPSGGSNSNPNSPGSAPITAADTMRYT